MTQHRVGEIVQWQKIAKSYEVQEVMENHHLPRTEGTRHIKESRIILEKY